MQAGFTIHQLRLFLKVADLGSFSRAATTLNLPQPSISRSISRLEHIIGTALFERSGRGIQMTTAGEHFLGHAEKSIYHHDQGFVEAQQLEGELIGEVRIDTPENVAGILFFPLIKYFQAHHPEVHNRVTTSASVLIPSLIDQAFTQQKLKPVMLAEIDANEPLLDLILDDEGLTILPYSTITSKSRQKQLSDTRIVSPAISPHFTLIAATSRSRPISAACRKAALQTRQIMQEQSNRARWFWDCNQSN